MDLIYLDYNCFQRRFDDSSQIRIQIEALACQEIFNWAEAQIVQLIWSFMHEDETLLCPFPERRDFALELSTLCQTRIAPEETIYTLAQTLIQQGRFSAKDILHVACAIHAKANFFLTCDDALLRQAKKLTLPFEVMNPIDYIRRDNL
ncbi:MAG: type II toxin-antitoxin system VapC family toxin [Leptolyngbyaceae cyanobacterium RU_5_1]|nr:type II toxin-antitoxin system VapC family toxin [Leptolyngbyaceae cyanobacterium RU_5_1]